MNKIFFFAVLAIILSGCSSSSGEFPGSEYMPDMGHSIAYEANYYDYYYYNTWGSEAEYYKMAQPRKPVAGTIPRGHSGAHYARNAAALRVNQNHLSGAASHNAIAIPANGSVPYYYKDTEEERTRAMNEIIANPYPITGVGLAKGKELYDIYCGICHGAKGDGNGYLVADENPNPVYPAQPAILTNDEFTAASNGRYYHAIMYGKNVMGGYADKLSYEERWQVIHYIRSLQAKNKKLVYDENTNTLNNVGQPIHNVKMISGNMGAGAGGEGHSGVMMNTGLHSTTGHGTAEHTTIGTIKSAVTGHATGAATHINKTVEQAKGAVEGAVEDGKKKGGKFKEKIKKAAGTVKDAAGDVKDKVKGVFKKKDKPEGGCGH